MKLKVITALVLASILITGCTRSAIVEIQAYDLCSEYWTSELGADVEYKDKTLIVKGNVDRVGRDNLGTPYVVLTSSPDPGVIPLPQHIYGYGVQCRFEEKNIAEITDLGNWAWIEGKCLGADRNLYGEPTWVILENCRVRYEVSVNSK